MRVVYINNIFNHHSKPIADAFYKILGDDFLFAETRELGSKDSLKGSSIESFTKLPYLYSLYNNEYKKISERALMDLTKTSDIVIQGAASDIYISKRLKKNKITFRVSEHFCKGENFDSLRLMKYFFRNFKYKSKPLYLLSASSHVTHDMQKVCSFIDKSFKWGYFPEIYPNKIQFTNEFKNLLWAGRMVKYKHPEIIINAAKILKKNYIQAKISVIGDGILCSQLKKSIHDEGLVEYVEFRGQLSSKEVQLEMSKADLFLFSSDIGEGWGAVLNESMGNGCIPIANIEAGSTAFLVKDRINGFIYDGSSYSFEQAFLKALLLSSERIKEMKMNAYNTIHELWSAETAVERLLEFIEKSEAGLELPSYSEGPMSIAFSDINLEG